MRDFFVKILELSISASILICVIILIRQISKKRVPHSSICLLWLLVGIRLLIPFSAESNFSLVPKFSFDKMDAVSENKGEISFVEIENSVADNSFSNDFLINNSSFDGEYRDNSSHFSHDFEFSYNSYEFVEGNPSIYESFEISEYDSSNHQSMEYDEESSSSCLSFETEKSECNSENENSTGVFGIISESDFSNNSFAPTSDFFENSLSINVSDDNSQIFNEQLLNVLCVVWLAGTFFFLAYGFFNYIKLKKSVSFFTEDKTGIRRCETIDSSFVFGIIRPKIYMPFGLSSETEKHIIAHEKVHIKRFDHISKILAYIALSIYWFCPLVWVWFILLSKDIEYACDEKAIQTYSITERKQYAFAILECSVKKPIISSCPVSFGQLGVKERVENTMSYKKPYFWIIIVFVLVAIVLGVLFLTEPKNDKNSADQESSAENELDDSSFLNASDDISDDYSEMSEEEENSENSDDIYFDESNDDSSNDSTSEDVSQENPSSSSKYDNISWKIENGVLFLEGSGNIEDSTSETPAPWLSEKDKITEIIMSDSIKNIGQDTFSGLTNLKKIKFSENLSSISYRAFKGCNSLESLNFPEKLSVIYSFAFESCVSLKSVHLPENLSQFSAEIFLNCKNLSEVTVSNKHQNLLSIDGVVYNKTKSHLLLYPSDKRNDSYEIHSGVHYVSSYSFYDSDFLESVVLPQYVSEIQKGAFGNCDKLKKITVPAELKSIKEDAFLNSPISEIYYAGTRKEWLLIRKGENWYNGDRYTVYCSDGNLESKPQNKPLNMWLPYNEGIDYRCFVYEFDGSIQDLVTKLGEFGPVPKGVKVLSFKIEGDTAIIDLSKEFSQNMGGSANETNIVESLVNTIIDNFNVKKVSFTVDGKILSAHGLYDSPIGFTRFIKLFVPNDDFRDIDVIETYCDGTMEDIISLLVEYKALPEGTKVLSHSFGMYVSVDLSKEFGDVYFADLEGKGKIMLDCIRGTLSHFYKPTDTIIAIDGVVLEYFVNA